MITINQVAPAFTLPDHTGTQRSLADWAGQWVLLYFYPKDDTPGCTTEACSLCDHLPKFGKLNAVIVGINADSVNSHAQFVKKYGLPFTLLADENKTVCRAYGTAGIIGVQRTSFLIDSAGKVAKIYEHVKPAEHAEQVLADIKA